MIERQSLICFLFAFEFLFGLDGEGTQLGVAQAGAFNSSPIHCQERFCLWPYAIKGHFPRDPESHDRGNMDLRSEVRQLCIPSRSLDNRSELRVLKLCHALVEVQTEHQDAFLRRWRGHAILIHYSSDATLIRSAVHLASQGCNGVGLRSRGQQTNEYLLQRAYLQAFSADSVDQVVLLSPPILLAESKKTWFLYGAWRQFAPFGPELHDGICLSHYAFDRGVYEALTQKIFKYHVHYFAGICEQGERPLQCDLDWPVATACINHDCHNSLKWALSVLCDHPDDHVATLHAVIDCVRNSFEKIHSKMATFLRNKVRQRPQTTSISEVTQFWACLDVDPGLLEYFVKLDPLWCGEWLWINCATGEEILEQLSHLLFSVFKFRVCTISRWLTLGSACRGLVGAFCCGLRGIIAMLRDDLSKLTVPLAKT